MVQGRGCMGNATLLPNQAPMVSYVLLKMCAASHCRGGTRLPLQFANSGPFSLIASSNFTSCWQPESDR